MISSYSIIRESAKRIAVAAGRTIDALRNGRIEQEPQFTDRMLGSIEESINGFEIKGLRWSAKTLTDRGSNAQEKAYGADFMGVLAIDLSDFVVKKGFLAQAKLLPRGSWFSKDECARAQHQCETMLHLSPDSFLFLYSESGIFVVPAISIVSMKSRDPYSLYSRSFARFFEEHFESFIGDPNINSPSPDNLETLMQKYLARRVISFSLAPVG